MTFERVPAGVASEEVKRLYPRLAALTQVFGVTMSLSNIIALASRTFRYGRDPNDGIHKVIGTDFVSIVGEHDDLHYAGKSLPPLDERVHNLRRLIGYAQRELDRLDPDGAIGAANDVYLLNAERIANDAIARS